MRTLRFIQQNATWLAAGFLLTFSSSFGQTFFISIFAGEFQSEFGLSHGDWGLLYMIGTLASAPVMIWAGALTDVFRVRVLGGLTLVLLALACVMAAAVSAIWILPFVIFFLRFAGQGMASHIAAVAMARWFVAARGRALSIASLGYAIGEALLPIIFVGLLVTMDWRALWLVSAAIALALAPVIAVLLRQERTPQSIAKESEATGINNRHWTRAEVLRLPLFWFILPTLLGPPAFGTAFFFLQVHLAELKDWTHLQLVSLFPIYTGVAVISIVLSGFVIDRFGTRRMMPFYGAFSAFGYLVFAATDNLIIGGVGIALIGITSGLQATIPIAFWAEFFGTRYLGSIKALASAIMVLGSAIGPGLTGALIDLNIGYETQLVWIAGYFLLACGLAVLGIRTIQNGLPAPS